MALKTLYYKGVELELDYEYNPPEPYNNYQASVEVEAYNVNGVDVFNLLSKEKREQIELKLLTILKSKPCY